MTTRRPTLAESSAEVRDDDIITAKLVEDITAANANYRRLRTTPINDHALYIESISNGGPVVPFEDVASQTREAAALCRDLNEAREKRHEQSRVVRQKALGALAKALLPEERAALKRVAVAGAEIHAALRDYHGIKEYLLQQGGLVGICMTDTEKVFGNPNDRLSDFAMLLREFVALGVLDKMPANLK
jgi:hypothetical protein